MGKRKTRAVVAGKRGRVNPADHICLVGSIAKRYGNLMPYEDLVQYGVLGLMRAVEKFDPSRGFTFATYAQWWVRNAISRALVDHGKTIRIPLYKHAQLRSAGELPREPASLDAPLQLDGQSEMTLHDVLPDVDSTSPEDAAVTSQLHGLLRKHVRKLSERERMVLLMRFDDELTLQQIGDHYGLTREAIRQIEVKALAKLRKRMEPLCA